MRTLEYQAIEQDDGVRLELILKRRLGLSVRQIRQLKFLTESPLMGKNNGSSIPFTAVTGSA